MELRITGRHATVNPKLRDYAADKLGPIERYDRRTRVLDVVLDHEPLGTTIEAKAHVGKGAPLVVHAKHATAEGAIDLIHDKLERALRRNKERVRDRHRQPDAGAAPEPGTGSGEEE